MPPRRQTVTRTRGWSCVAEVEVAVGRLTAPCKVFYKLDNAHVRQLVEDAVFNAEHAGGDIPQHHRADAALSELPHPTGKRSKQS